MKYETGDMQLHNFLENINNLTKTSDPQLNYLNTNIIVYIRKIDF